MYVHDSLHMSCKTCYTSPSDLIHQTWSPGMCRPHSNSQHPPLQFGREKVVKGLNLYATFSTTYTL